MTGPGLSVLLPVRNGGRFLAEAIASVRAQSFTDFELILIDDGSPDGTPALIRRAAQEDARIVWAQAGGRGLVHALNLGIELARAPFLARMDADDVAAPHRFAQQMAFLAQRPEIAVVGAQAAVNILIGSSLGGSQFPTEPSAIARHLRRRGCCLSHPTIMMRRSIVQEVGGYRPCMQDAEDYDLWLRVSCRSQIANVPERLLAYRVHGKQISSPLNLRQRFSHDLALLSDRRRQQQEADPTDAITSPPLRSEDTTFVDPDVQRLVWAYRAAQNVAGANQQELEALVACSASLLGGSRRFTVDTLTRVSRRAAQTRDLRIAGSAAVRALKISPGRALRSLWRGC